MSLPTPPDGALPPPPPPSYVPYGQPEFVGNVKPIALLSRTLGTMLLVLIPLQALAVADSWSLVGTARDYLAGRISDTEFENASGGGLGTLAGFLVIPIAVVSILWMQRMAQNLRAIGRRGITWSPGWAIGGWFVPPGVLYVVPWLMFRELWKASAPDVAPGDTSWKQEKVPPIVDLWWVLYGLVPILGIITSADTLLSLTTSDDYVEVAKNIDRFATLNIVLAILGIVATGVYHALVRQWSARHMRCTHEA